MIITSNKLFFYLPQTLSRNPSDPSVRKPGQQHWDDISESEHNWYVDVLSIQINTLVPRSLNVRRVGGLGRVEGLGRVGGLVSRCPMQVNPINIAIMTMDSL